MNKRTEISLNQEEVQYIIDCYEKDIEYIKQLEEKVNQLEKELERYENKEIEKINKNLLQAENDYLERHIKANMVGSSNE